MFISMLYKRYLSELLMRIGYIQRLISNNAKDKSFILMYHRILNRNELKDWIEPGMYVAKDTFELQIRYLKTHFDVLPLSKLIFENLDDNRKNRKPKCAITFDDGWYDFYKNAFSILKKYKVPATVFIPTNYINSDKLFWTDLFMMIVMQARKHGKNKIQKVNSLIKEENYNIRDDKSVSMFIKKKKNMRSDVIEGIINKIIAEIDFELAMPNRTFLNWDEINILKGSELIHFGSHTANHLVLSNYSDSEIEKEIKCSMEILIKKKLVEKDNCAFCYPNGNVNYNIANIVKKYGYSLAVTTKKGWICRRDDKFMLKRIGIHQDVSFTESLFSYRIAGI